MIGLALQGSHAQQMRLPCALVHLLHSARTGKGVDGREQQWMGGMEVDRKEKGWVGGEGVDGREGGIRVDGGIGGG